MAGDLKGLTVQIGGNTTELGKALETIKTKTSAASKELTQINRLLKLDPGNSDLLAQKQTVLAEKITATKQKLEVLKQAQEQAAAAFADGKIGESEYRKIERDVIAAQQELDSLQKQAKETGEALRDSGKKGADGAKKTADAEKEIGNEAKSAEKKVSSFGDILKGSLAANVITDGLRAIKDGIKDIESATIASGSTAETALAKLATIADTGKLPLKDIQAQIIDLSNKTGESVADLSESVYSAISGGVDTADAVAVVEKATQLAAGGFTSTATAIDVLTTAINAYGLSTDDAAKLSDYLLITQNLGKTTVDELAGSMGKVIPLASAYGVQMDNLSSAYAIMTANGIATTESTTYLKSMLKELGDSGSTVSEVLQQQTGKTFAELNAEGMSLGDVLSILGNSVDGDTGKFNELWSSSEAGIGALSILGSGTERYTEVLDTMRDSAAATESAYATMTDTFEHKSDALKNTLQNLEIEGFDGFKQSFKDAMDTVNEELQSDKTHTHVKKTGAALGDLAGKALNLTAKVLPVLADGLSIITKNGKEVAVAAVATVVAIKGFSIVSTAKAAVKGFTTAIHGMNAAISSNPIGLMLTAISSLIAILMTLSAVTDTAAEKQAELADAYQDAADSALDAQRKRAQSAKDIQSEYDEYRNLVKELDGLVDADGRVKEGYENRVNYIRNELSDATGTEIELVDGVIQKYDELSASIENVLIKKQAEAFLTANQGEYDTAKNTIYSQEIDEDGNYVAGSQAAAEQARLRVTELKRNLELIDNMNNGIIESSPFSPLRISYREIGGAASRDEAVAFIAQAEAIAKDATYAYDQNKAIITQFEGVQGAVWADDAEAISTALESATSARMTAADATLSSLEKQRDAAIEEYNQYLEWSQQEGSSVTQEQVSGKAQAAVAAAMEAHMKLISEGDQHTQEEIEASRAQLEALMTAVTGESQNEITNLINSIESDAKTAGSSYVDGIVQGLRINGYKAYNAGYTIGKKVDDGYRDATETESPSKVARKSASWYPVGVALGIADTAEQPVNAVKHMAQRLKSALNGEISASVLDFGAWGGNLSRYEKNTMVSAPTDLGGVFDRLERIRASVDAIDPNVYLDGQKVSDRLTGYTDVGLGRRAEDQQRGRMK